MGILLCLSPGIAHPSLALVRPVLLPGNPLACCTCQDIPVCYHSCSVEGVYRRCCMLHSQCNIVILAAGSRSADTAAAVSLASVDLTFTIAGGQLQHQESLPASPGPFGSPHQAAPVFGVHSRRPSSSPQEACQPAKSHLFLFLVACNLSAEQRNPGHKVPPLSCLAAIP